MRSIGIVSIFILAFAILEALADSTSTSSLNCQPPEQSSQNKSKLRASKTLKFQSFRSLSYVNLSSKSPLPEANTTIQASVFKPEGKGPFAAVIVNHGSAGVGSNHFDYAKEIVAAGKVAVVFDGFCPRNISGTAGNQSSLSLITSVADNYRLLAELQKEPYIDEKKISAIGTSRGGSALILAADEKMQSRFQIGQHPFSSFAAIYPGCSTQLANKQPSSTRLLVQLGKMDTYFSPERCREVIASMKTAKFNLETLEYNAHHGWDLDGSPKNLPFEMSYGKCNMIVGSDGVPTEKTSGIRMDSMSNSKKAFEACGTKGAFISPSVDVKRQSMADLMQFLDVNELTQKNKNIGVTR